ncbi:MAG: SAF domain-containing protein [Angustibacter sp.]
MPLRPTHAWLRRLVASTLLAVAVVSGLKAVAPDPPAVVEVLVARRTIALGSALTLADLQTATMVQGSVPGSAIIEESTAVGRVTSNAIGPGELITDTRLIDGSGIRPRPGEVLTSVRILESALLPLIQPGQRVDLLSAIDGSDQARVLARKVALLAVLPDRGSSTPSPPGFLSRAAPLADSGPTEYLDDSAGFGGAAAVLVISATPDLAAQIAQATARSPLSVTVR